jgi:uncharacterized Fe-S cluster protein YjdI
MAKEIFKYTNGETTVVWQPKLCIHSTNCWKGLIEVFNPRARPWVNMNGSSTERIIEQVSKCPSGALRIETVGAEPTPLGTTITDTSPLTIEVSSNGPLLIHSPCLIKLPNGQEEKRKTVALCRCGASAKKPFCDGSHKRIGFQG